jgi:hypothetical protein
MDFSGDEKQNLSMIVCGSRVGASTRIAPPTCRYALEQHVSIVGWMCQSHWHSCVYRSYLFGPPCLHVAVSCDCSVLKPAGPRASLTCLQ